MRAAACLLLSMLPAMLQIKILMQGSPVLPLAARGEVVLVTLLSPPPALAAPAADAVATPGQDHVLAGRGEGEDYLPVARLTERPQAMSIPEVAPASVQPLESFLQPAGQTFTCLLLISEQGDIDRVLFDAAGPTMTPAQQQAWQQSLRMLRFTPGRLYGRPVKSALRIEVSGPATP